MRLVRVDDGFSVMAQPVAGDMAALAAQGFVAVVNNRPDGEEPGQPAAAEMAAAAARAGLGYSRMPVVAGAMTRDDAARFRRLLAAAAGPVVAHCRSGSRSLTLWAAGEVMDGRMSADDARLFAAGLGYDLAGLDACLAAGRGDGDGDDGGNGHGDEK